MNHATLITSMSSFADELPAVVRHVTESDAKFKPPSGAWSILEIVCHLVDEEVEDFRTRLRLTLDNPATPWPEIDPPGAAIARRYNERNLHAEVQRFVNERHESVAWLRSLSQPKWANAYVHPKWGPISAGMLMTSWAAHDLLHLRQIAKRRFELAAREGAPYTTSYAGDWGP